MKKQDGLTLARKLRRVLLRQGYPVRKVILFGSTATGKAKAGSDIDIAIVTDPFLKSPFDENVRFSLLGRDIDIRIETVCLHPIDFENRYFTLAKEVERHGIPA